MKIKVDQINTKNRNFKNIFQKKIETVRLVDNSIVKIVSSIIKSIKKNGDKALQKYINKYDGYILRNIKNIVITSSQIKQAYKNVSKYEINNLKKSIKRIKSFSQKQSISSWKENKQNTMLGEKITPIESVGIYVPGGKASYPSTVMMNTIPAKVAGVKNIIMSCPLGNIDKHSLVLVAADLCGVDKIFNIGGAHAIAALAYGTKTVPKVDKIVGPGNIFVTLAKKSLFGEVGIDNIAGPSEVVIIADQSANPKWIAIDLFSQAEHDELSQAILISSSLKLINSVEIEMNKLIRGLSRKKIIQKSLNKRGIFIKTKSLDESCKLANDIAPEHLGIICNQNHKALKMIKNAF